MAVMNTGLLTKGLRSEFYASLAEQQKNASNIWQSLATRVTSDTDKETYKWLGSVPQMREWGTGRVSKGLRTETFDVTNLKYEATIDVDRDEISDDQTGQIRMRIQELAQRAATHKDFLLVNRILNASTAGFHSYDGVPFFDASHVSGASGSQDNEIDFDISNVTAAPGEPDDVDNAGPKTLILALSKGIETMMLFKDDQGEFMHRSPTGFAIVCHWRYAGTWLDALKGAILNQTSNVQGQAAPIMQVIPLAGLTDVSQFYLFKLDEAIKPFIFQDREPLEFVSMEQGSDLAFQKEVYRYGVRARYTIDYGEWMNAVSVNLTT